jgi:hypothetical protein
MTTPKDASSSAGTDKAAIDKAVQAALAQAAAEQAEAVRVASGAIPLPRHAAGPDFSVSPTWGNADQLREIAADESPPGKP